MPTYPPRSEPIKKQEIFLSWANKLKRAFENNLKQTEIEFLSTKVRYSYLKLLKGKLASLRYRKPPNDGSKIGAKIEREIKEWENFSTQEIIDYIKEGKLK